VRVQNLSKGCVAPIDLMYRQCRLLQPTATSISDVRILNIKESHHQVDTSTGRQTFKGSSTNLLSYSRWVWGHGNFELLTAEPRQYLEGMQSRTRRSRPIAFLEADLTDDLSGNGIIIISGTEIGTVFYWLSVSEEVGPVVAEGSISGSEEIMLSISMAADAHIQLEDGPTFRVLCEGGTIGTRWIKTLPTYET
jgi:hypothetical protein